MSPHLHPSVGYRLHPVGTFLWRTRSAQKWWGSRAPPSCAALLPRSPGPPTPPPRSRLLAQRAVRCCPDRPPALHPARGRLAPVPTARPAGRSPARTPHSGRSPAPADSPRRALAGGAPATAVRHSRPPHPGHASGARPASCAAATRSTRCPSTTPLTCGPRRSISARSFCSRCGHTAATSTMNTAPISCMMAADGSSLSILPMSPSMRAHCGRFARPCLRGGYHSGPLPFSAVLVAPTPLFRGTPISDYTCRILAEYATMERIDPSISFDA